MGSMLLTETFDHDKLQGMFDAFAELPYKVLWKANKEKFAKSLVIPDNIQFEKWMPQMDILCKLFSKEDVAKTKLFHVRSSKCKIVRNTRWINGHTGSHLLWGSKNRRSYIC